MTHIAILFFFGTALAAGLYCLWVSLRVEFSRVPRFLRADSQGAFHAGLSGSGHGLAAHSVRHPR